MGSTTFERSTGTLPAATPIDSLPLSNRTRSRLVSAGIETLEALMEVSDEELLNLRGFGHVCLSEVRTIIRVVESGEDVAAQHPASDDSFPREVRDPLLSTPIDHLPIPNRARRVFQRERIVTISDYLNAGEEHLLRLRNFGTTSLTAVNRAIHAAIRSTEKDASMLRRFQSSESLALGSDLEQDLARIPVAALDLPRRARRACQEMGLRTLRDLARISTDDLLVRRNFGQATLRRIQREVERFVSDREALRPTSFLITIEQLLGRLQEKEQRLVELREGRFRSPMTLTDAGSEMDITESRACQIEHSAWHKLRRFAAGLTDEAADRAVDILMREGGVADADALRSDPFFADPSVDSRFLGRMLAKLIPHRLARLSDGRLAAAPAATLFSVAARLRKRLRRSTTSQPLEQLSTEVLRGLDLGDHGKELVRALCEALFRREVAADTTGDAQVRTPVQGLGDDLRRVLEQSPEPLHFREISERLQSPPFSRTDLNEEKVRLRLCRDPRFILVRRGLYDLVERFRVEPEEATKMADFAQTILERTNRPTSVALLSAELRRKPEFEGVTEFVLAAVLREDARFQHVGRGTFVTGDRVSTDVQHVSEILETILRESGGPLTYGELRRRVQEQRKVSDGAISATLVGRRTFLRIARGEFDLAERHPFDDARRRQIATEARQRLEQLGWVASLDDLSNQLSDETTLVKIGGVLLGDLLRREGGFRFLPGGFAYVADDARERELIGLAIGVLETEAEPLRPSTIARRLQLDEGSLALLRDLLKQHAQFIALPDGRVQLASAD